MKKLLFLALAPILIYSNAANAIGMDYFITTSYWSTCWRVVNAKAFIGQAQTDIEDIKVVHNMQYHVPVMDQDNENTSNLISLYQNDTQQIVAALGQAYSSVAEARATLDKNFMKEKLEYLRHLSEAGVNEDEYGFFNDGNGQNGVINKNTQSYSYFKNACKRNKMFSKITSPSYNVNKSMKLAENVIKGTTQATQNAGVASQGTSKIKSHFSEWCSKEEIESNLCDNTELSVCNNPSGVCKGGEEFKLTNGDMNAANILNPEGWKDHNSIPDELFFTGYTYDEDQLKAAKDFAYNAVYSSAIEAPSVKEKGDPTKAEFVTAYNSNLAALNLAHFTYENLMASRKPITEEGDAIMMSELDVMHYIMHNMKNPDNLATIMSGKEKTMDLAMFTMLTLKNKLEFNRYEQQQRIEALLAAVLAQVANSPSNQSYSRSLVK
jgi:hypothetical protein